MNSEKQWAISQAFDRLIQWQSISGHIHLHSSLYYEIQSLIEDAVFLGRQSVFKELDMEVPEEDLIREDK